jgi:hypothetical protein
MYDGAMEKAVTKRQLGVLLILLGAGAIVGLLGVDVVGAGQFQGIGPVQRVALALAGMLIAVGISLLPLGDRPA